MCKMCEDIGEQQEVDFETDKREGMQCGSNPH